MDLTRTGILGQILSQGTDDELPPLQLQHRAIGDENDEEPHYESWIDFSFPRINQFLLIFGQLMRDEGKEVSSTVWYNM